MAILLVEGKSCSLDAGIRCDWCDQEKETLFRVFCKCGNKKAFIDVCQDCKGNAIGGECPECSDEPWE